jgi:hypothetical protein
MQCIGPIPVPLYSISVACATCKSFGLLSSIKEMIPQTIDTKGVSEIIRKYRLPFSACNEMPSRIPFKPI